MGAHHLQSHSLLLGSCSDDVLEYLIDPVASVLEDMARAILHYHLRRSIPPAELPLQHPPPAALTSSCLSSLGSVVIRNDTTQPCTVANAG